ncbi:MAG: radical SAM protein [Candidatus Paceibacterota bacterium]
MKKKYKILLIQLPVPGFRIQKHWGNVPLAAGYLKSMAYKEGLLKKVDIEILSEQETNLSSDSALINLIISKSPDMLGFSLYMWNSIRSLFIAGKVKKNLPNIKIVMGGPEVTLETRHVLDDPAIDIGCLGEGEFTFIEIIKSVLNGQSDYANIKSVFYKKQGKNIVTPPREPTKDLDVIPSPYLLGFINPKDYGGAWLENVRGCPFKCAYCTFPKRPLGFFSTKRIYEELKVIRKSKVKHVHFVNGAFAPNFYEICEKIKKINKDKKICFYGFSYAEHLNERTADLLKECNFTGLDMGLQSVNVTALEAINRKNNLEKFVTGINLLRERNIEFVIDIIIGLPGDTLRGFKRTLKFLKDNKCNDIQQTFLLSLLPGAKLRGEAEKYGIKYQDTPPFFTIETPCFSKNDIKKAIILAAGKPRLSFPESLISHCNIQYPWLPQKAANNSFKIKYLNNPVNKVILELDSSRQKADQLKLIGKRLSRIVSQPFTVWFKTRNVEKDLVLMESFLSPIAASNPFLLWSIIVETDDDFSASIIKQIKKNIPTKEKINDNCRTYAGIQTCIIRSWRNNKKNKLWSENTNKISPFFWSLNISEEFNWQKEAADLLREKNSAGILVDFNPKSGLDFIINAISFLREKGAAKKTLFRNLAFDRLSSALRRGKLKDISIIGTNQPESVLSIDRDMNMLPILTPDSETTMDLIEFQIKLRKALKRRKPKL